MANRSLTTLLLTLGFTVLSTSARAQVDLSPLPLTAAPAFANLRFDRPIVLTHADDGSNRVFVASQLGSLHVFPNDQQVEDSELFLDIRSRVVYKDKQNEEGLLGFAFHPKYKENGQFFLYYTTTAAPHTSVVSRFRVSGDNPNRVCPVGIVSGDNPNRADPESEEELLRVKQPFWNHNGGTICFGPDGYLYIALGDGGSAKDPLGNGQNRGTLLGSIMRIDVDNKAGGKAYAIPKDNPFVGDDQARNEIWAYGLRNVWRMTFDRQTGTLWAADVGQDIWEEINLIQRGGNYGWNLREGQHPFGPKGSRARKDLIDPIWEYHHSVGKSITGGHVYRGKRLPQLEGAYLYADYVRGTIWALWYNSQQGRVVANRPIGGNIWPVLSFGEDETGEVYFLIDKGTIHRFSRLAAE